MRCRTPPHDSFKNMSSNYGYGYDTTYAAYAGYAAAQYSILQQQQQQQMTTSSQVGYGHTSNTANTTGYAGQYQQPDTTGTNQLTKPQPVTPSSTNQTQYSYVSSL